MENELAARRIGVRAIETFGTPRRLVLTAAGVASVQTDLSVEKLGPCEKLSPLTRAAIPPRPRSVLPKGQGIDISQVTIATTDKGEYICAKKHEKGVQTATLLPEICSRVIAQLPFPKSMRWKDLDMRFARPIHWIVALYNGAVVPFTFGNIDSGDTTRGHRFMAPDSVKVTGITSYLEAMKKAHVVIDQNQRKKMIIEKLGELAKKAGGVA